MEKDFKQLGQKPLKQTHRPRKARKRYQKDIPGERVQMDMCQMGPKLYQHTATDDCTHLKIVRLYPNKQAESILAMISKTRSQLVF